MAMVNTDVDKRERSLPAGSHFHLCCTARLCCFRGASAQPAGLSGVHDAAFCVLRVCVGGLPGLLYFLVAERICPSANFEFSSFSFSILLSLSFLFWFIWLGSTVV